MALIDRYVTESHFSERHSLRVHASADAILTAAATYRTESDPFFQRMIALRELPMRIGRFVGRRSDAKPPFGLDTFTLLERGDREIVYGLAGRFWRSDFDLAPLADGRDFIALNEPGMAKLALNFAVHAVSEGVSVLSTETRIHCIDRSAKVRFTPYWYLIRPVSGLIRQRTLRAIRATSEAPAATAA